MYNYMRHVAKCRQSNKMYNKLKSKGMLQTANVCVYMSLFAYGLVCAIYNLAWSATKISINTHVSTMCAAYECAEGPEKLHQKEPQHQQQKQKKNNNNGSVCFKPLIFDNKYKKWQSFIYNIPTMYILVELGSLCRHLFIYIHTYVGLLEIGT